MMKNFYALIAFALFFTPALAQDIRNNPGSNHGNRFEQLGSILPTPNEYRTASGAPGPKYWQQRCDYDITCDLDEANKKLGKLLKLEKLFNGFMCPHMFLLSTQIAS